MNKSKWYISKAKEYCDLLQQFADGNIEYDRLFDVLDCLKLDRNYTLALHRANDKIGIGDVSWFYCYEGDNDIYRERFNNPDREKDEDFFQCFGNLNEFEIFNHLSVEKSEMGAWQTFLLSIALSQLPTYWHGGYRRDHLVFSNEDIKRCHPDAHGGLLSRNKYFIFSYPELYLLPEVWPKYNMMIVRSCFFNMWKGVVRRTVAISFDQERVTKFERVKKEVSYTDIG